MNELPTHALHEDDRVDQIFSILGNPRRRHVLDVLYQEGGTVDDLHTLTALIAARENDKPPHTLSERERKRVYVSLKQTHIPTLRETDAISVDPETGSIKLTDNSGHYGRLLGWSSNSRRYIPYLSLAIGSSLFYLSVLSGLVSHDWITLFGAGLVVFLLFGALALVEPYLFHMDGRDAP